MRSQVQDSKVPGWIVKIRLLLLEATRGYCGTNLGSGIVKL